VESVERWGGYRRREEAVLGVNLGRPIVTNGSLLRSCVKVHEPIELSFVVVIWVRLGIHVLDGVHMSQGEKAVSRDFHPIGLNGVFFAQKCIRLVREKWAIFPYGLYIVGIYDSLAFQGYSHIQGRCWGLREIRKNVTDISGADRR